MRLWYVAHPVRGRDAFATRGNLVRAAAWYAALCRYEPDEALTCPWLGPIWLGAQDDVIEADRERGLRDAVEAARRCDGIVLCGPVISTGMRLELDAVVTRGGLVADLTALPTELPEGDPAVWRQAALRYGQQRWAERGTARLESAR